MFSSLFAPCLAPASQVLSVPRNFGTGTTAMRRLELGRTGIEVSELCLGTMTWGRQTGEAEAHAQLDLAIERGIDFLDTAEMYPVNPVRAETVGDTETIIGNWIARGGKRDAYVMASKITGKNGAFVRPGQDITPVTLRAALDASLRRMRTDYLDLYQLHWPNRGSYNFRQNWEFDPSRQDTSATLAHIAEVMEALTDLVAQGKIRAFGLSNDSAWGTMQWLRAAELAGGPRVASVQNEYSLLHRIYDTDMAELGVHEDVTLLAYSPLATGLLSGKYMGGAVPQGSRMASGGDLGGRATPRAAQAVEAYAAIAARHGLDPTQMAIAWTLTRPFPIIPIIGATTLPQLEIAIAAADLSLSPEILNEISAAHRIHPMPY